MIWLEDGRELKVRFDKITLEQVEQWKPGRNLTLAYSAVMGCVLVDEEIMDQLPVIGGWGDRHPLDLLLEQNLQLDYSTMDIVEALNRSSTHWEEESDRLYLLYLESEQVPPAAKEAIRAEQAAWLRFRDEHAKAAGSLYSLPGGTMWRIKASEHYHALLRGQARRLQDLLEALDCEPLAPPKSLSENRLTSAPPVGCLTRPPVRTSISHE
jgi:uncharacterized protein YecT (DUF1311 family)